MAEIQARARILRLSARGISRLPSPVIRYPFFIKITPHPLCMNAFQFQTVPSIVSEFGLSRRLGPFLRENKYQQRRAAVVTDRFLH